MNTDGDDALVVGGWGLVRATISHSDLAALPLVAVAEDHQVT